MKSLILLAVMIPAVGRADTKYSIKATGVYDVARTWERYSGYISCGASERMMSDRHYLNIADDGTVTINRMKWNKLTDGPDMLVKFHDSDGQYTILTMDLYINRDGLSGAYILEGVVPDKDDPRIRNSCVDAVKLDGIRR